MDTAVRTEGCVTHAIATFAQAYPDAERVVLDLARLLAQWPGGVTPDAVERAERVLAIRKQCEAA